MRVFQCIFVRVSCVAACCSVLQCVAVCCSVLQRVEVCCSVLQRMNRMSVDGDEHIYICVCTCVLQRVAVCCSVLQRMHCMSVEGDEHIYKCVYISKLRLQPFPELACVLYFSMCMSVECVCCSVFCACVLCCSVLQCDVCYIFPCVESKSRLMHCMSVEGDMHICICVYI